MNKLVSLALVAGLALVSAACDVGVASSEKVQAPSDGPAMCPTASHGGAGSGACPSSNAAAKPECEGGACDAPKLDCGMECDESKGDCCESKKECDGQKKECAPKGGN